MPIYENTELTPREHMLLESERDEARLTREHALRMKELEITLAREKHQADVTLRTLEAKWTSWLKLPSMLIKLPLYILLGLGYVIQSIRGKNPTDRFWNFITR